MRIKPVHLLFILIILVMTGFLSQFRIVRHVSTNILGDSTTSPYYPSPTFPTSGSTYTAPQYTAPTMMQPSPTSTTQYNSTYSYPTPTLPSTNTYTAPTSYYYVSPTQSLYYLPTSNVGTAPAYGPSYPPAATTYPGTTQNLNPSVIPNPSGSTTSTTILSPVTPTPQASTISCISSLLTPDEQALLNAPSTSTADQQKLSQIQQKTSVCFADYSQIVKINKASSSLGKLSDESKQCVIKTIGLSAYNDITNGVRDPLTSEKASIQPCLVSEQPVTISYQASTSLDSTTDMCVKLALGDTRYAQIKKGSPETFDEQQKAERCFGTSPNPLDTKTVYQLPSSVTSCLQQSVSPDRYTQITNHQSEPTDSEKAKASACFSQLNPVQTALLPLPPQQVPYLPVQTQTISVGQASQTTQTVQNTSDTAVVLKGKATPNSLVNVYVFSDPIVVETTTDENGDWVYTLNDPLQTGTHVAYAAVKTPDGSTVRSAVFNFSVAEAAGAHQQQLLQESRTSNATSQFLDSSIIIIIVAMIIALAVAIFVYLRLLRQAPVHTTQSTQPTPSMQGQREGEHTSGPVQ